MAQLKMLISHEHKLIYVWVPKCGSSTMYRIFQALVGVPDGAEKRRVDVTPAFLADYNADRIQVKWRDIAAFNQQYKDYRKITIVRNPYDRLLSAYHNKIDKFAKKVMPERCEDLADEIAAASKLNADIPYIRRMLHKRISLNDVIESLANDGTKFDVHFEKQTQHLHPNRLTYDHVFRLESFDQDLTEYLSQFAIPADVMARISRTPRHNRSKKRWFSRPKLNKSQRQQVFDIYQTDFDTYSYEK